MNNRQAQTQGWLQQGILPVVVLNSVEEGLHIAHGLIQGGITQIEITLRTPDAFKAMSAIAHRFPEMSISAGTVLSPTQLDQAADQGATLFISPGFTETLAAHAIEKNYNWVPGVATASELMRALELGFDVLKFFPAMAAGGPKALESISTPLPQAKWIPTGGIALDNLSQWHAISSVKAVGGTWITTNLNNTENTAVTALVAQRAGQALAAWAS